MDSARHFGRLHRWWSFCRLHLSSGFYFCIFSQQGFLGFALYTHHDIGLVEFQRQIFLKKDATHSVVPADLKLARRRRRTVRQVVLESEEGLHIS